MRSSERFIFPGSSMVERRPVKAMVVGSNPTRGADEFGESDPPPSKGWVFTLISEKGINFIWHQQVFQ